MAINKKSVIPHLERMRKEKRDETFIQEKEIENRKNAVSNRIKSEKAQSELAYQRALDNVDGVEQGQIREFNAYTEEIVENKIPEDSEKIRDKYDNTYLALAEKMVERSSMSTANKMEALELVRMVNERVKNKIYAKKMHKNDDISRIPVDLPNKLPVVDQDHIRMNPDMSTTTIGDTVVLHPGRELLLCKFEDLPVSYRNDEFQDHEIGAFILQLKLRSSNIAIDLYLTNTEIREKVYGTAIVSEGSYNYDNSLMINVYKNSEDSNRNYTYITIKNVDDTKKQEILTLNVNYNMILGGNLMLPNEITEPFYTDSNKHKRIGSGVIKGQEDGIVGPINNNIIDRNYFNALSQHLAVSDSNRFGSTRMVRINSTDADVQNAHISQIETDITNISQLNSAKTTKPSIIGDEYKYFEDGFTNNEQNKEYYDKIHKNLYICTSKGLYMYDYNHKKGYIIDSIPKIRTNMIKYDLFDRKLKVSTEDGLYQADLADKVTFEKVDLEFFVLNKAPTIYNFSKLVEEEKMKYGHEIGTIADNGHAFWNLVNISKTPENYKKCEDYEVKDFISVTIDNTSVRKGEKLVSDFSFIKKIDDNALKIKKIYNIENFYTKYGNITRLSNTSEWNDIHNKKIVHIATLEDSSDLLVKYMGDREWTRVGALDENCGYKLFTTGIYDTTTGEGVIATITDTNKLFITNDLIRWREIRLPEECNGNIWEDIKYIPNVVPNELKNAPELTDKRKNGCFIMIASEGVENKRAIVSHDCERWYVMNTPSEANAYKWKFIVSNKMTEEEISRTKHLWTAHNDNARNTIETRLKRAFISIYTENLNESKMLSFNGTAFTIVNSDITDTTIKAKDAIIKELDIVQKLFSMPHINTSGIYNESPFILTSIRLRTKDSDGKDHYWIKDGISLAFYNLNGFFLNPGSTANLGKFDDYLGTVEDVIETLNENEETSSEAVEGDGTAIETTPIEYKLINVESIYENLSNINMNFLLISFLTGKKLITFMMDIGNKFNFTNIIANTNDEINVLNRILTKNATYRTLSNGIPCYVRIVDLPQIEGEILELKANYETGFDQNDHIRLLVNRLENGEHRFTNTYTTEENDEITAIIDKNQKFQSDIQLYHIVAKAYYIPGVGVTRDKDFVLKNEKVYFVNEDGERTFFKEYKHLIQNCMLSDIENHYYPNSALSDLNLSMKNTDNVLRYGLAEMLFGIIDNKELPDYDMIKDVYSQLNSGDTREVLLDLRNRVSDFTHPEYSGLRTKNITFIPYKYEGKRNVAIVIGRTTRFPGDHTRQVYKPYLEIGNWILTDFNYENIHLHKYPYSTLRENEFDRVYSTGITFIRGYTEGMCEYYEDYNTECQYLYNTQNNWIYKFKENEDGNTEIIGKKFLRGNATRNHFLRYLPQFNSFIYGDNYRTFFTTDIDDILNMPTRLQWDNYLSNLDDWVIMNIPTDEGYDLIGIHKWRNLILKFEKAIVRDKLSKKMQLNMPHPFIKGAGDTNNEALYKMLEAAGVPYEVPCKCSGYVTVRDQIYYVSHVRITRPYDAKNYSGNNIEPDYSVGQVQFLFDPNYKIAAGFTETDDYAYNGIPETVNTDDEVIGRFPGMVLGKIAPQADGIYRENDIFAAWIDPFNSHTGDGGDYYNRFFMDTDEFINFNSLTLVSKHSIALAASCTEGTNGYYAKGILFVNLTNNTFGAVCKGYRWPTADDSDASTIGRISKEQIGCYDEENDIVYFMGYNNDDNNKPGIFWADGSNLEQWTWFPFGEEFTDRPFSITYAKGYIFVTTCESKVFRYKTHNGLISYRETNRYFENKDSYTNNKQWKTVNIINKRNAIMKGTYSETFKETWEDPVSRFVHNTSNTSLQDKILLADGDLTGCRLDHDQEKLERLTPWGYTDSDGYNQSIRIKFKQRRLEKIETSNVLDPYDIAEYSIFDVYTRNWHQALDYYENKSGIEVDGKMVMELEYDHGFDTVFTVSPNMEENFNIRGSIIVAKKGSRDYYISIDGGETFMEREFPANLDKLMLSSNGKAIIMVPEGETDSRNLYISYSNGLSFEREVNVKNYKEYENCLAILSNNTKAMLFPNIKTRNYILFDNNNGKESILPLKMHVTEVSQFEFSTNNIVLRDEISENSKYRKLLISSDGGTAFKVNIDNMEKDSIVNIKSIEEDTINESKYKRIISWNRESIKVKETLIPVTEYDKNEFIVFDKFISIPSAIKEVDLGTTNIVKLYYDTDNDVIIMISNANNNNKNFNIIHLRNENFDNFDTWNLIKASGSANSIIEKPWWRIYKDYVLNSYLIIAENVTGSETEIKSDLQLLSFDSFTITKKYTLPMEFTLIGRLPQYGNKLAFTPVYGHTNANAYWPLAIATDDNNLASLTKVANRGAYPSIEQMTACGDTYAIYDENLKKLLHLSADGAIYINTINNNNNYMVFARDKAGVHKPSNGDDLNSYPTKNDYENSIQITGFDITIMISDKIAVSKKATDIYDYTDNEAASL